jgi:hypothetical protein
MLLDVLLFALGGSAGAVLGVTGDRHHLRPRQAVKAVTPSRLPQSADDDTSNAPQIVDRSTRLAAVWGEPAVAPLIANKLRLVENLRSEREGKWSSCS